MTCVPQEAHALQSDLAEERESPVHLVSKRTVACDLGSHLRNQVAVLVPNALEVLAVRPEEGLKKAGLVAVHRVRDADGREVARFLRRPTRAAGGEVGGEKRA